MKKGIALLLALLMIMSSLFVVSSAEDGAVELPEAEEEIINEILTLPGEEDPEEVPAFSVVPLKRLHSWTVKGLN